MSAVNSRTDWKREVTEGAAFIIRRSARVWSMNDDRVTLLIFGVYEPTLLSKPELWMVMPEGFSKRLRRNLQFARSYLLELLHDYPLLTAHAYDAPSAKFLTAIGMKRINETLFEVRA